MIRLSSITIDPTKATWYFYIVMTGHRVLEKRGFSLVEVVLALSVVSFSCVTLIGLLATGLITIHQATTATIQAQITQAVINDSQVHPYATGYTTTLYFDDEGTTLSVTDPWLYSAKITSQTAKVPDGSAGGFSYANTDTQQLKVQVTSKASGGGTFYLLWPHVGP